MPLIISQNIEKGVIGLWKISEDIDELLLLARLSAADLSTYSGISALHRKKEWLSTRALLNEIHSGSNQIKYHNDGRPYLDDCTINISISHSIGYIAILLHETSIPGIDIELINRKVGRVASRFLSPDELIACNVETELSNHRLLLHWCAKEAIFKMIPVSNIEFSTDIQIILNDDAENTGSFQGFFIGKKGSISTTLYHRLADDLLIVWGWIGEDKFGFEN